MEIRAELAVLQGRLAKPRFFDQEYGKLYWQEHDKYNNLWQCKTEDPEFTEKLENYLKEIKNESITDSE